MLVLLFYICSVFTDLKISIACFSWRSGSISMTRAYKDSGLRYPPKVSYESHRSRRIINLILIAVVNGELKHKDKYEPHFSL